MDYYNDSDPASAAWIESLIEAHLIPTGQIDSRDIREVKPNDLAGRRQCHFFAGIGGWTEALRLAGWPEDRPVWTGSCPCPPFSSSGKKKSCPRCGGKRPVPCPRRTGFFICSACEYAWHADGRHLWPEFWRLIRDARPSVVIGEQVASADGRTWLAGIRGSLEILGYAVGCADLCVAGVGSPHIRQRLFWVAKSKSTGRWLDSGSVRSGETQGVRSEKGKDDWRTGEQAGRFSHCGTINGVGHPANPDGGIASDRGLQRGRELRQQSADGRTVGGCGDGRMAVADRVDDDDRRSGSGDVRGFRSVEADIRGGESVLRQGSFDFWSDFDIVVCRDADEHGRPKRRRIPKRDVEPGVQRVADGIPAGLDDLRNVSRDRFPLTKRKIQGRVQLLRGYGNAISPQVAATFIKAFLEAEQES